MSSTPSIKDIFGDALDLPVGEREAFVLERCAGHPAVLAEVRQLLAAHAMAAHVLHTRGGGGVGSGPIESPGTMVGRYKLLEVIGEGGFGTVFMAEQREPVSRRVALKVIKPGMDTAQVVARFEAERQALAVMDHPHIAKVLDAGATESGRPYFVMELVKGEPITGYCDLNNLTISERLDLFTQVCQAVQHAHTKGVIHRDLKPSNILVSTQDGRPQARVIDFGIAKAVDRRLTERTVFTEFRQLIGTPEYMSPEQAEGGLDIDTRSDVYSLGVLLYELLTGSTPFDGQRLRSAAFAELQRIIREDEPPKPSTRLAQSTQTIAAVAARRRTDAVHLSSLIKGELDWIVMKALDKDRARRYESPGSLASDLQRFLAGDAVTAAPPSAAYRFRKLVRRHRAAAFAGVVLAVAAGIGLTGLTVGFLNARAGRVEAERQSGLATQSAAAAAESARVAEEQSRRALQSARTAEAVSELMNSTVRRANRAKEQGRADITVREVMDAAAAELLAPGVERAVALRLSRTIGATYRDLGMFDAAERMFRIQADHAAALHGPDSVELGRALGELGSAVKQQERGPEAAELYARASEILDRAGESGRAARAVLGVSLATLLGDEGKLDESERELRESVRYFDAHPGEHAFEYMTAVHSLAVIAFRRGDAAAALPLLKRTLAMEHAALGDANPDTLETLHGLAVVQASTGDPEAEATLRRTLAAAEKLRGRDHHQVANLYHSLGVILSRKGDLPGAEEAHREALRITRAVAGDADRQTALMSSDLAVVLIEAGKVEEAAELLRTATPVLARFSPTGGTEGDAGRTQADTMFASYRLAKLEMGRGAWVEAEALLRTAVAGAAPIADGARYEWLRCALSSALGGAIAGRAETVPPDQAGPLLDEAARLAIPAAERLIEIAGRMGPRNRALIVGESLDRAIKVHAVRHAVDPSPANAAALAVWTARREEVMRGLGP